MSEIEIELEAFASWLEERALRTEAEFKQKGWGNTKVEVRRIKEEFDARFRKFLSGRQKQK